MAIICEGRCSTRRYLQYTSVVGSFPDYTAVLVNLSDGDTEGRERQLTDSSHPTPSLPLLLPIRTTFYHMIAIDRLLDKMEVSS